MTGVTDNGDIVLDTLPQPQQDWVMSQIGGLGLMVSWCDEHGYFSDFASLCLLLDGAGLQGLGSGPH